MDNSVKALMLIFLFYSEFATSSTYLTSINKELAKSVKVITLEASNPANPTIKNVCAIKLSNLTSRGNWNAALSTISLHTERDKFDFGTLLSSSATYANFDNATVNSSSTYSNSDYYYVAYAISGYENPKGELKTAYAYWLANSYISSYTIKLKTPTNLSKISLSDNVYFGDLRGTKIGYKITAEDCNNNTIFSKTIYTNLTPDPLSYAGTPDDVFFTED